MARVLYVHWQADELKKRAALFIDAGHDLLGHHSTETHLQTGDFAPDFIVISLDRLPSHGRAIAEWFRESKKRRVIPLVFVGGAAEKVAATREKFPDARFCSGDNEAIKLIGKMSPGRAAS